jgi:lipopolysaccharide/colanic/teichoic acid biosynthesis glycosyltransferase
VGVVPHLGDVRVDQLQVEDLSAIPVLRPYPARSRRVYLALKRLFDLAGATLLLTLTAPLWALAAALIWVDSPGPVFFVQERVGRDGHRFRMVKFRTMRRDTNPYAPSPNGHVDPRITRVGRVLRVAGFDELPQLINVLRGEMTLVGPRPEMPFLVGRYTPVQRLRLLAKPGITGVWQLSADRHAEIHENIEYDLYYISRQSLLLDLVILVETVFFTVDVVVRHLFRKPRQDTRAVGAAPTAVAWERTPALDSVLGMKRETVTPGRLAAPSPERSRDPSVLVALDQRRSGGVPENWQIYLPAAYAVSRRWPVRVLVAADNLASLDGLLDEPVRRLGTRDYRTDFAPYGSGSDLRALTLGVRAVITDLPHVAAWAKAGGIDVLCISDHTVSPFTRSGSGRQIVAELARWLPAAVRMKTATVEEG